MDLTLTVPQLVPPRAARRATTWRRTRRRTGGSLPDAWDDATPIRRVVTLTAMAGTPADELAVSVAQALALTLVDRVIPERVAEVIDVSVRDAQATDSVMPSKLARAFAWGGAPLLTAEIDGVFAEVRSLERYHEATQEVIRGAVGAPSGSLVVGRGAAFLLASHPRALHVYVDAPIAWRAAVAGARMTRDFDQAQARYARSAYSAVVTDRVHYGLVFDASVDDLDTMVKVVVAEAARRGLSSFAAPVSTQR
jgi:hypothetical protein